MERNNALTADVGGPAEINTIMPSGAALILSGDAMDRMMKLSTIMASGRSTIPKHLQGNPGDCLAVIMQAVRWRMDPFAVAQKTHIVSGQLGYEGQLVNAAVVASGVTTGRFTYEWYGPWENVIGKYKEVESKKNPGEMYRKLNTTLNDEKGVGIRVSATLKGESEPRVLDLLLTQAGVRNSPLWADDPRQQLAYLAVKRWSRLYAPDVILGVYTPDELDDAPPPAMREMGDAVEVKPDRAAATAATLAGGKPREKPAPAVEPPTLDEVLAKIAAAETPDEMSKAGELCAMLGAGDKDEGRKAYSARMKVLRAAAAGPSYAEIADQINRAQSVAEVNVARDLIRSIKDDGQRAELESLASRRCDEFVIPEAGNGNA